MVQIANSKGQTLDDPCSVYCGAGDITAWAEVVEDWRDAAAAVANAFTVPQTAGGSVWAPGVTTQGWNRYGASLVAWVNEAEKYGEPLIGGLGSGSTLHYLGEFGLTLDSDIVRQQVREIRKGEKLTREARAYLSRATKEAGANPADFVPGSSGSLDADIELAEEIEAQEAKEAAEWDFSDYAKFGFVAGIAWLFWKER
jgi:hypothetical protein